MVHGTLEVLLVGAKGLDDSDFLSKMDPYAILICRTQEQRSSIASGVGSDPEWNETFVFTLTDHVSDLTIKLMDSDSISNDDYVGEAKIPLESLFMYGSLPPTVYNVVKDQEYCGEIKVSLTFTPAQGVDIIRGVSQMFGFDVVCSVPCIPFHAELAVLTAVNMENY